MKCSPECAYVVCEMPLRSFDPRSETSRPILGLMLHPLSHRTLITRARADASTSASTIKRSPLGRTIFIRPVGPRGWWGASQLSLDPRWHKRYRRDHLRRRLSEFVLRIDPKLESERARKGWQSHLARARWMTVHGYRRLLLRSLPMLDPTRGALYIRHDQRVPVAVRARHAPRPARPRAARGSRAAQQGQAAGGGVSRSSKGAG